MISFAPTDEEAAILETVERFADTEIRPAMRDLEAAGAVDEALRRTYHEMGLATLSLPEEVGGLGMGLTTRVLVEEALGHGDPGAALALDGPGAAGELIAALGTDAQRATLLGPFSEPDGHTRAAALALLEPHPFEDVHGVRTTARADGDGFVIDGDKSSVVHGGEAGLLVVVATLDRDSGWDGVGAFVVERGASGLVVGEPVETCGLGAAPIVDLSLEGVRVPATARLGGDAPAAAGLRRALARARVVNAARVLGLGRASLEYAVGYAKERSAFGQPISEFQGLRWMLADMATEVDAARWMLWRAARELDADRPGAERAACLACVHVHEMAKRVTVDGVQVLGGAGFMRDYPVEKWYRDMRTLACLLGTDPMLNARAAALTLTRDGARPIEALADGGAA